MALVSYEEGNRRLEHSKNLFVKHSNLGSGNHNNHGNSGRPNGSTNYSREIKALIGIIAKSDGVKTTANKFGLATSQVSHYKNGKTQVQDGILPDKQLRALIRKEEDNNAQELRDLVSIKIKSIVESIDDDKIHKANLSNASKAASNLASVYDKFGSKALPDKPQQNFVFFGVPPKAEDEYEILEAEVVSR